MANPSLSIKFAFKDKKRRLRLESPSFAALENIIFDDLSLPCRLFYRDSEGDLIALDSQEEYDVALSELRPGETLHLIGKDFDDAVPDAAANLPAHRSVEQTCEQTRDDSEPVQEHETMTVSNDAVQAHQPARSSSQSASQPISFDPAFMQELLRHIDNMLDDKLAKMAEQLEQKIETAVNDATSRRHRRRGFHGHGHECFARHTKSKCKSNDNGNTTYMRVASHLANVDIGRDGRLQARSQQGASSSTGASNLAHYDIEFVSDETVPDGSTLVSGECLTKVWRVRNVGSAPLPAGCELVANNADGNLLSFTSQIAALAPGEEGTIEMSFVVPDFSEEQQRFCPSLRACYAGKPFGHFLWMDVTVEKHKEQVEQDHEQQQQQQQQQEEEEEEEVATQPTAEDDTFQTVQDSDGWQIVEHEVDEQAQTEIADDHVSVKDDDAVASLSSRQHDATNAAADRLKLEVEQWLRDQPSITQEDDAQASHPAQPDASSDASKGVEEQLRMALSTAQSSGAGSADTPSTPATSSSSSSAVVVVAGNIEPQPVSSAAQAYASFGMGASVLHADDEDLLDVEIASNDDFVVVSRQDLLQTDMPVQVEQASHSTVDVDNASQDHTDSVEIQTSQAVQLGPQTLTDSWPANPSTMPQDHAQSGSTTVNPPADQEETSAHLVDLPTPPSHGFTDNGQLPISDEYERTLLERQRERDQWAAQWHSSFQQPWQVGQSPQSWAASHPHPPPLFPDHGPQQGFDLPYREGHEQLVSMGFMDQARNTALLNKHKGDVAAVLAEILPQ